MKILQINNCHYRRGGADVVYLNTGALLEKMGHEVIYFSQKNKNNYETHSSKYFVDSIDFFDSSIVKKILMIPRFFYSTEAKNKLEKLILNEKPDIAHIHTYKGTLTPSILKILKSRKIPTVISLHDYGLICPHNSLIDGKGNPCTKCIDTGNPLNCIYNRCNRNKISLSVVNFFEYVFHSIFYPFDKSFQLIIAVSRFSEQLHKKKKKLSNKVVHLYNFFPNIKNIMPVIRKGNYFLFYGRLSEEKGLVTLIKTWKKLPVEFKLKIAGDGPVCSFVNDFITTNKMYNVEYVGFKQGDELNNLIKNSSFIIVPSEWYENNPLTIIEAYSYGKPVIGADIGGITELITNKKTGYLFSSRSIEDLSGKIIEANSISGDQYNKMALEARKFAELNFDEETHYKHLLSFYKSVILE